MNEYIRLSNMLCEVADAIEIDDDTYANGVRLAARIIAKLGGATEDGDKR